jgi:hypothetical protein
MTRMARRVTMRMARSIIRGRVMTRMTRVNLAWERVALVRVGQQGYDNGKGKRALSQGDGDNNGKGIGCSNF